jgi:hypothetical protein
MTVDHRGLVFPGRVSGRSLSFFLKGWLPANAGDIVDNLKVHEQGI